MPLVPTDLDAKDKFHITLKDLQEDNGIVEVKKEVMTRYKFDLAR